MAEPDSLSGWLDLLEQRHAQGIQLGLERVSAVAGCMAASTGAVVITVGGTNGKGSTCAMLETILRAAGYRTGLYSSPHLLRYNERVRIDGREASDEMLVEGFHAVEAARGDIPLTYFEHGTLAAWHVFCLEPLDAIILEVGLGGRLDAVNVFEPDCAIVTGVAMDHQEYLGDTREAVGFEKAGIFRANKPAICGDPQPPEALVSHAEEIGAELWLSRRDFGFSGDRQQWTYWRRGKEGEREQVRRSGLGYPALRGANQLLNAASVLTALEALRSRLPVSMQAIREGLMHVELSGRFQLLPGRPAVVLDVAHNMQAAGALAENLFDMGFFSRTRAVLGMYADKDVEGVVRRTGKRIDEWYLAGLPGPRGLSAEALAERVRGAGAEGEIRCFENPAEAYRAVRKNTGENDRIVAFGSFVTVAEVMAVIESSGADVPRVDNDDLELRKRSRRRLVGAAALALLAVIILPMVMDDEPVAPMSEIQVSIPERALNSRPVDPLPEIIPPPIDEVDSLPTEVEQTVRPLEVSPPEPEPASEPAVVAESRPVAPEAESKPSSPVEAKPPAAEESDGGRAQAILEGRALSQPAAGSGSFVVQVGAFSDVAKASARRSELAKQGFETHIETSGGISRVRIGPFVSRADAEVMLKKLAAASIDGVIATR